MRSLVTWSVRVRTAIVALAVAVLVLCVLQLPQLSVDTLPEFSRTTVEVQTEALGLSAREVEQLVTVPLEQNLLNGVAFLEDIESASLPGLSSVIMTFEPGTPFLTARQVVTERLTQASGLAGLAQVARPPQMLQPRSSTSRVALIGLSSSEQSLIEMSVLARWVIVPRLLGVQGVANVSIWGFRDRQLQVLVDPAVLRARGVTLDQVVSTTGNALEVSPLSFLQASSPGTGGWIETVNQRLHVFHEQAISTPAELEQVPLESSGNVSTSKALTLGDVADVVEDHQPLVGDAYCPPPNEDCLLLVVESFPDANVLDVSEGLDATIEALLPGLGAIEVDTSLYRPDEYIKASSANLGLALGIGFVLFIIILWLSFRRWRRVVVAAMAVPVSLMVALLVLAIQGITVNAMIVAGLVLGLVVVVDDAIAATSRALTHPSRTGLGNDLPAWRHVVNGIVEVRVPLLYGTVIGVLGALFVLFASGESRVFVAPAISSYLLAIGASLVVGLTVTPALAVLLLSGDRPVQAQASEGRVTEIYDRLLKRAIGSSGAVIGAAGALLTIGIVGLVLADSTLRPSLREGDVLVHIESEPGTSLERMDEVTSQAISELSNLPGVQSVVGHVGRAVASDQVVDVNSGEIWLSLDTSADYTTTLSSIRQEVDELVEVEAQVLTYSEERIRAVLQTTDPDRLTVRVYGEDQEVLENSADQVRAAIAAIDGVTEVSIDRPAEEPVLEVEVDLAAAQRLGVSPGDVRRAAAILLSGLTVGNMFDEQKVFDVVVWGSPDIRQSEDHVRELLIETRGGYVRLDEVADVRIASSPAVIRHHSVMTYRDVVADVPGGSGSVAGTVERALDQMDFPLEYHAELLGPTSETMPLIALLGISLATALGVFLLMQAAFASWRLGGVAFVALLLALTGGVLIALVTGRTITIGSAAGLVGTAAYAARSILVLVGAYRRRSAEGHTDGRLPPRVVAEVTKEQTLPILTSAVSLSLLFAPFAVAPDVLGFEILHPMALALLGGLLTSLATVLVVVPVLCVQFGRFGETAEDEILITLPSEVAVEGINR